jgi:CRP-like cAMP-binding protein
VRGLWISLAVVASLRLLSLGSSGLGVLMAAAGVGALVAIFAAVLLVGNGRLANWFALGLLLCGLPIAAVGLAGSAAPAIVLMVVWGVGMSLSDVGAQTLLNRIVPAASIGRVTGAMESGKLVFEGFGSLIAPALLVGFGVRGALFAAGGVLPVAVLLGSRGLARIDDRAVGRVEILELLRRVPFFVPLRLDALEGVASRLQTELHPAGTEVVRQGEPDAHRWYLVDAGELVVEVDGFLVGELRRGDQFGERGLLRGVPRSATVRTVSDVVLYALERDDFLAAVAGPDLDETEHVVLPEHTERVEPSLALARAPLLHGIGAAALDHLSRHTRVHDVEAGATIVLSGGRDDTYHVLLSGRAQVVIDGAVRRELLPGDAFGEIAILHRVPRTASVVARDQSTVLTVDGEAVRHVVREHGGAIAALAS